MSRETNNEGTGIKRDKRETDDAQATREANRGEQNTGTRSKRYGLVAMLRQLGGAVGFGIRIVHVAALSAVQGAVDYYRETQTAHGGSADRAKEPVISMWSGGATTGVPRVEDADGVAQGQPSVDAVPIAPMSGARREGEVEAPSPTEEAPPGTGEAPPSMEERSPSTESTVASGTKEALPRTEETLPRTEETPRGVGEVPSNPDARVTREELKKLLTEVAKELEQRPPVIGLIGVSGVGKSSTINTMFKTDLETSDTVACTKEFKATDVEATFAEGNTRKPVTLRVIDAPGLGEDVKRDPEYLAMYRQHLPQCDVILWILTARNRAVALDQRYLEDLKEFHGKMVFGLNQIDLTEPLNWDETINLPSKEQEKNIETIVADRRRRLEDVVQRQVKLVPYSAKHYVGVQELFLEIINACPPDRAWIFRALKAFGTDDFLSKVAPKALRDIARDETGEPSAPELVRKVGNSYPPTPGFSSVSPRRSDSIGRRLGRTVKGILRG